MVTSLFVTLALSLTALPLDDAADEARQLLDGQHYPAAIEHLKSALESDGADERALLLLMAEARLGNDQPGKAREVLMDLEWSDDYEVALTKGRVEAIWATWQESAEDREYTNLEAVSYLQRAAELAPDGNTDARVELGFVVLDALGDHAQARALAEEGLAESPDSGELVFLRGAAGQYEYWNLLQTGDEEATQKAFEATVADLKAATEKMPRDQVGPWSRLQWMYEMGGRPAEAVNAAIQIIDRQPDSTFDGLYLLARRYAGERQYDAAGAALEKMVSLSARELTNRLRQEPEEDFPWVTKYMAFSVDPFMRRNDQAMARSILAAIVASDPVVPSVWSDYAAICQQTARYEDAINAYERLLALDDSDPRVYNDFAAILHYDLNRDLDKAKEMYQKCIDMSDKELAMADVPDARRAHLSDARRIAQNNLNQLQPPQQSGSLLDSMLDGLRNLDLPEEEGEGEESGDASADSGEGESESETGDR